LSAHNAAGSGQARGRGSALDLRGRTITTAIVSALRERLAELAVGEEVELLTDAFPPSFPTSSPAARRPGTSSSAWRRTARAGRSSCARASRSVTTTGWPSSSSTTGSRSCSRRLGSRPLPLLAVPTWRCPSKARRCTSWRLALDARLRGWARPFSRCARAELEKAGHVAPAEKLRQLQTFAARLDACGRSLEHFGVDPDRIAFRGVVVCEYLTFTE
jgi:hypothetical protein